MSKCQMCKQEVDYTTEHHLIPRKLHSKKRIKNRYSRSELNTTIPLCKHCHFHLHQTFDEKYLGENCYTIELILKEKQIIKWIKWLNRNSR